MNKIRPIIILVLSAVSLCLVFFSCEVNKKGGATFDLQVFPESMRAIAGQRCVFLVTVEEVETGIETGHDVKITATIDGADVIVEPALLKPGKVCEVTVIPRAGEAGNTITLTVTGQREHHEDSLRTTIEVIPGDDQLRPTAETIQARFIPWLAENHPELGITTQTIWVPSLVTPEILIVANYLFFSEEWEMGLTYHVMIAPDDWARIYLRKRYEKDTPTYGFEISSLSATDDPIIIDPPESVLR